MQENDNLKSVIDSFTKIVTFNIVNKIKHFYQSLDEFKDDWTYVTKHKDKRANLIYSRIVGMFHIESNVLQALTRNKEGKRCLSLVLKNLDKRRLVHKCKKTAVYKSGKQFQNDSWFYIPFPQLDVIWNNPNIFNTKSEYYSKHEHKLIDKWILGYRIKRTYDKTARFYENIQKQKTQKILAKCQTHKDLTSSDLDYLISNIEL